MHRALVLVIAACTTQHYMVDPRTDVGQRAVACMDKCSPSIFDECAERCHVETSSECGEVGSGFECKPTRQLHWVFQGLIYAVTGVMAVGGVVGYVMAE